MKLSTQIGMAITAAKAMGLRDWGSDSGNSETGRSKTHVFLGCKLVVPNHGDRAH